MKLKAQRLIILLVFAIFFLPVIAAIILNSQWTNTFPGSLKNKGYLIQPPILLKRNTLNLANGKTLPTDANLDVWIVVIVESFPCDSRCFGRLSLLSNMKTALGKDIAKVPMLLQLVTDEGSEVINLETLQTVDPFAAFTLLADKKLLQRVYLMGLDTQATKNDLIGKMFVINNGYMFMHYDIDHTPNDLWLDLKRLLKAKGRGNH